MKMIITKLIQVEIGELESVLIDGEIEGWSKVVLWPNTMRSLRRLGIDEGGEVTLTCQGHQDVEGKSVPMVRSIEPKTDGLIRLLPDEVLLESEDVLSPEQMLKESCDELNSQTGSSGNDEDTPALSSDVVAQVVRCEILDDLVLLDLQTQRHGKLSGVRVSKPSLVGSFKEHVRAGYKMELTLGVISGPDGSAVFVERAALLR